MHTSFHFYFQRPLSKQVFRTLALLLFCCGFSQTNAQCKHLSASTLKQLAKGSYSKKVKKLYTKAAKQVIEKKEAPDCKATTFVLCKNYISDTQWHWADIISFNSCDNILTYSTSNQLHFNKIKKGLTKRYTAIGKRTYSTLVFDVFQNKKGQVIEINEHPNQEGITFYLINIIRSN